VFFLTQRRKKKVKKKLLPNLCNKKEGENVFRRSSEIFCYISTFVRSAGVDQKNYQQKEKWGRQYKKKPSYPFFFNNFFVIEALPEKKKKKRIEISINFSFFFIIIWE
jgi:hypothetical protein